MFGKKNELQVQVEQLPDVFEDNGLALVEIEDDKVINRIISAVPQLAQAGVNVGAIAEGVQLANQGVYQAILPAGAKFANAALVVGQYYMKQINDEIRLPKQLRQLQQQLHRQQVCPQRSSIHSCKR